MKGLSLQASKLRDRLVANYLHESIQKEPLMRIHFLLSAVVLALAGQAQASSIAAGISADTGASITAMSTSSSLATKITAAGGSVNQL